MKKYQEYINAINHEKEKELLTHFNEIYECFMLQEREWRIIYLAYLWKNEKVYRDNFGMSMIDDINGVKFEDYELSIEVEDAGGVNLDIMYDYYNLNKLIDIVE